MTGATVNDAKTFAVNSAKHLSFKQGTVVADFLFFQCVEVGQLFLHDFHHGRIELGDTLKVTAGLIRIPRSHVRPASSVQRLDVICNKTQNRLLQNETATQRNIQKLNTWFHVYRAPEMTSENNVLTVCSNK